MSAEADLRAAIEAVEIVSPLEHAWLGERPPALPRSIARNLSADEARGHLAWNLRAELYANFYSRGRPSPAGRTPRAPESGSPPFVAALSAVNAGRGPWEPGWTVTATDGTRVQVHRNGLTLLARQPEVRAPAGGAVAPGAPVELHLPNELLRVSPGFYSVLGDRWLGGDEPLVRVYWHVEVSGALPFVAAATARINEAGLPARLKVVNHPDAFGRCDAAVLYLRRQDLRRAGDVVAAVHAAVAPHLTERTPALTKRLAPGVALAEDPGGGASFGLHRCGLLAEALIRAHEDGLTTLEGRLARVRAHLAEAGVDPERPYLDAGSRDDYDLPLGATADARAA